MSQWAGIESGAPTAAPAAARAPQPVAARRPVPRLRRTERLIIGSIDGAAHILQRRARDVLVGSALFMVPMVAVNLLLSVVAFDQFDAIDGVFGERGYLGVETGFSLLAVLSQSFTAHLIGAYTAAYLVKFQMGGEPTIRSSAGAVLRRLPLLLITWVVTHCWVPLLALWVFSVERTTLFGVAWFLPFLVALLSAAALLVAPVVMSERLGLRSLGRAWRLARTRFGAAYGFVWACFLVGLLMFLFIAFLPPLAETTGLITFGSYTWLLQGVASQIAGLIVMPFTAIATAQLYLQVRVHAEGLDITMAADRAFGERS
ncbi:MAG: hypothetical protein ABMA25_18905 [Ilumatobacteraceae bacterium]